MILLQLIRKGGLAQIATATPATPATQQQASRTTVARVATVAVASDPWPARSEQEESTVHAWLAHIGETDPETIGDILNKFRTSKKARAYFLLRAQELPPLSLRDDWVKCHDCHYFQRTDHPNLGHCVTGEPEAIAGLWDTDTRWCENFKCAAPPARCKPGV